MRHLAELINAICKNKSGETQNLQVKKQNTNVINMLEYIKKITTEVLYCFPIFRISHQKRIPLFPLLFY